MSSTAIPDMLSFKLQVTRSVNITKISVRRKARNISFFEYSDDVRKQMETALPETPKMKRSPPNNHFNLTQEVVFGPQNREIFNEKL